MQDYNVNTKDKSVKLVSCWCNAKQEKKQNNLAKLRIQAIAGKEPEFTRIYGSTAIISVLQFFITIFHSWLLI